MRRDLGGSSAPPIVTMAVVYDGVVSIKSVVYLSQGIFLIIGINKKCSVCVADDSHKM